MAQHDTCKTCPFSPDQATGEMCSLNSDERRYAIYTGVFIGGKAVKAVVKCPSNINLLLTSQRQAGYHPRTVRMVAGEPRIGPIVEIENSLRDEAGNTSDTAITAVVTGISDTRGLEDRAGWKVDDGAGNTTLTMSPQAPEDNFT